MTVTIKVKPKSSWEKIEKTGANAFSAWTHEAPEKGKVNQKIRALLSSYFNISKSKISLKTGQKSRTKIFRVAL